MSPTTSSTVRLPQRFSIRLFLRLLLSAVIRLDPDRHLSKACHTEPHHWSEPRAAMQADLKTCRFGTARVVQFRRPASMRFGILSLFWIMGVGLCAGQNVSPPQFSSYTGPTIAFPGTGVSLTLEAHSFQTNTATGSEITFELLEAPTNASLAPISGRGGEWFAWLRWLTPSRALVGTTNAFTIRATDQGQPPLSSTNTIRLVLVDLPPLRCMWDSNGALSLQFSNPIPAQAYLVLWSADLSATNWMTLRAVASGSSLVTVTDTNAWGPRCFYRLMPEGGWSYGLHP